MIRPASGQMTMSLPSRGAWIEIRPAFAWWAGARVAPLAGSVDRNLPSQQALCVVYSVAPLAGSVDRNDVKHTVLLALGSSLPSRGAWIEIHGQGGPNTRYAVAPLAGSVDRNANASNIEKLVGSVAPLAGSVDRNGRGHGDSGRHRRRRSPRGERG